jgi:AAA15 family ATPase/GTPase
MVARHGPAGSAKSQATFDMREESDGTLRLIDFVPAIMALTTSEVICIIDELDRSLHPEILHSYLAN